MDMEDSTLQIENFHNSDGSLKIKTSCSLGEEYELIIEFQSDNAFIKHDNKSSEISKEQAYEIAENIIKILKKPNIKSGISSETVYSADIMWDYDGGIRGTWALTTRDMPKDVILKKLPNIQNPIEAEHFEKALKLDLYNQTYALHQYIQNFFKQ